MADVYDTHGLGEDSYVAQYGAAGNATAKSLTNMTNIAGAVVSLALIAGVGVWGYKLMVRDVSGIPVVRAVQGDMRVRPEEPGGQLAMNQGWRSMRSRLMVARNRPPTALCWHRVRWPWPTKIRPFWRRWWCRGGICATVELF